MSSLIPIEIFELRDEKWQFERDDLENYLSSDLRGPSFIFAESDLLKNNDPRSATLHQALENFYGMPAEVWSELHWEANGFFGCNEEINEHSTWFHFLIKQLIKHPGGLSFPENYDYEWYHMVFFSTWSKSGQRSILCLDCPQEFVVNIRQGLDGADVNQFVACPYSFHQIVIRSIVNLYDKSIWTLRDVVRQVEKDRKQPQKALPDYNQLHEAARHVIHSTETLQVSTTLAEKIMNRQKDRTLSLKAPTDEEQLWAGKINDRLSFYHGMLFAFLNRSQSFQARHQNEIQLYHSRVAVADATAMRIIAALTVGFLPATFVSAIFSMSFFNYDAGEGIWAMSDKFWLYWAIAIPLTIATGVLLMFGNKLLRYYNVV